MKIEAGKYYCTRDGRKVGPIEDDRPDYEFPYIDREENETYREDGTWELNAGEYGSNDLVSEWAYPTPSPAIRTVIRTVRRSEIVPGIYGGVEVCEWATRPRFKFDVVDPSATDLRAAAELFNEIADVLDENAKEAA